MGEIKAVPILFEKKEDCCGCGACLNICPKHAISMQEDECGFVYPVIDEKKCIRCGLCKSVCAFQNVEETNEPIKCYAAVSKNREQAEKSASAGIFAAFAQQTIEHGGVVYGAAFDDKWGVHHIAVENISGLEKLQGSKYAHSYVGDIYSDVKEQLDTGREVLFSGTPCQIAALNAFLKKDYKNLITIDIVCHGVPSNQMLQDYLKTLEKKHGGPITAFTFRDKRIGWGINGCAEICGNRIPIWQSRSSYLHFFSEGLIYRKNCYSCKYACKHRSSDLTIGDFWGIEKQHPEFLGKRGWDESKGISLLITNTQKGIEFLERNETVLDLKESTYSRLAAGNTQLKAPSRIRNRDEIIQQYAESGWDSLEKRFEAQVGLKKYSSQIKSMIPVKLKRYLKKHSI